MPPLLTIKQMAEILGISEATGHRWAGAGELEAMGAVRLGHRWHVRTAVLRRWLEGAAASSSPAASSGIEPADRRPPDLRLLARGGEGRG